MEDDNKTISFESPPVETVFLNALEIESPDERATYIEKACTGNGPLHREVEQWFDSMADADDFFKSLTSLEITAKELVEILSDCP